jgi:hypothetical protein
MRDRITSSVRGIAERIHRSHTQDAVQLERARGTISSAITQPSLRGVSGATNEAIPPQNPVKKAVIHGIAEAVKNSAPAVAVGFGARYILGTTLGVQALAVSAGASAVSRGVREATFTIRKGAFAETTKLITRHEEASTSQKFGGSERVLHTGIRAKQDKFAQTGVGRVVNAVLHGGEKKIAEFAYGKEAHAKALVIAQSEDIHSLSVEKLIQLREHAVMVRITHGTAPDVYETRQLAKSIYQAVNLELKKRDISRSEAHQHQLRLYRADARKGMAINVFGQAALAAAKAIPKTIGSFFMTDGILKAIHVDTSARHSPLEGLDQKVAQVTRRFGKRVEDGITQLLNASTPHAEAAELTLSEHLTSHDTPVLPVTHLGQAITGTHTVAPEAVLPPAAPQKIVEIQKAQQEALQELRDLRDHAPMVPRVSGSVFTSQPVVVPPSTVTEAHAVLTSVSEMQTAGGTIQVDGTSLSQTLWNMRSTTTVAQSLPWLAQAKTLTEAYTSPDSAHAMWEHVILPSRDKIATEGFSRLQALFESPENAHASFAQVWKQYHALNPNDHFAGLDTWGYEDNAQTITLAVDHADTVGFADGSASATHAARMSIPEHETLPGGPKVRARLVRMELNTINKDHTAAGSPPPMTATEYEAMKARILNGGTTPLPASSSSTPPIPGHRMSAAEYEAMKTRTVGTATTPPTSAATGAGLMPKTGMSPAEYEAMKARSSGGIPSSSVAPPGHTPNTAPRMTVEEYEKMKQVSQAAEQVKPKASSTMTPDQYEQMKREILAKNGGVPSASSGTTLSEPLPLPHTEAPIGPIDLREAPSHAVSISSNRPDLFTNVSNGQWTQVVNPEVAIDTPGYSFGSATYFYDKVHGGMVISMHDGRYNKVLQAWEGMREYPQGYGFRGAGRLGPIQQEMRISKIFDPSELAKLGITQNTFDFNFDGKTTVHTILESVQYSPQDGELILGQPANLIGGSPDTITAIICSWGHVEAIQMILDHAKDVPPSLQSTFAILNDPQASGGQIEKAVQKLVNEWLKTDSDFDFAKFHHIFGNFLGDKPKTFDELLNRGKDGLVGRGRLVLRFRVSG